MKTKAQYTKMLSHRGVEKYSYLVKEDILPCCKSPKCPPGVSISPSVDRSHLNTNDPLMYDFKARLISSPVVQCKAVRSYPKHLLTRAKASQGRPHCLTRKNHQGNVSSLYSKYHHYPCYHRALIRRTNLLQLLSETSPMVLLCLRNRSSVSYQTKKCSFKRPR